MTDFTSQGATEGQTTSIGDESHLLTRQAVDGTTTVDFTWYDRNVMAEVTVQGLAANGAVQAVLDLAKGVEQQITRSAGL